MHLLKGLRFTVFMYLVASLFAMINLTAQTEMELIAFQEGVSSEYVMKTGNRIVVFLNGQPKAIRGKLQVIDADHIQVGETLIAVKDIHSLKVRGKARTVVGTVLQSIGGAQLVGGIAYTLIFLRSNDSESVAIIAFLFALMVTAAGALLMGVGSLMKIRKKIDSSDGWIFLLRPVQLVPIK